MFGVLVWLVEGWPGLGVSDVALGCSDLLGWLDGSCCGDVFSVMVRCGRCGAETELAPREGGLQAT